MKIELSKNELERLRTLIEESEQKHDFIDILGLINVELDDSYLDPYPERIYPNKE